MNQEEFKKLLQERIDSIIKTLDTKGKEYSTDLDKLHNFNEAAKINGQSREMALWGMATKHLVSVIDIIKKTNDGIYPDVYTIKEKFGDLINYLILAEICLKEEYIECGKERSKHMYDE